MKRALFKTIVAGFYQVNAGMFLLVFLVMFGILNGEATIELHRAIMEAITGAAWWCLAAVIFWCAYSLRILMFIRSLLLQPASLFLYTFRSVPDARQYALLSTVFLSMYAPALLYAAITIAVGIANGSVLLPMAVLAAQILICIGGIKVIHGLLNFTHKPPVLQLPEVRLFRRKPFNSYLLHYSVATRKGTFIAVKLFSLLLLQGMVLANSDKISKEAICVLIMFLISAHSLLPVYYHRFIEGALAYVRNTPAARGRVLLLYFSTYCVVFIPECLFLFVNHQHAIPSQLVLSLYTLAVAHLLLCSAILYLRGITTERYTLAVFGLFFISLLSLASAHVWVIAVAELTVALLVYYMRYYRYETAVT